MQKTLLRIGKALVSVALVWVIWRYFVKIDHWDAIWLKIKNTGFFIFILALLTCFINWGLEAIKWQILLKQLEPISFRNAWKSTCAGVTISNILPFRIGEYLGRIVYVKSENRIPAAFNSVFGSTVQLCISLVFGIPGSFYVLDQTMHKLRIYALLALLLIVVAMAIIFLFSGRLGAFGKKWISRLQEDIRKFTVSQILQVVLLSTLRYLIFSSFYVFLLLYFGVISNAIYGYCAVATIYLIQSFAPSMVITDAGLRTGIPIMVLKVQVLLQPSLLAAAIINYFFNILFPALLGLYFIIARKVRDK